MKITTNQDNDDEKIDHDEDNDDENNDDEKNEDLELTITMMMMSTMKTYNENLQLFSS